MATAMTCSHISGLPDGSNRPASSSSGPCVSAPRLLPATGPPLILRGVFLIGLNMGLNMEPPAAALLLAVALVGAAGGLGLAPVVAADAGRGCSSRDGPAGAAAAAGGAAAAPCEVPAP